MMFGDGGSADCKITVRFLCLGYSYYERGEKRLTVENCACSLQCIPPLLDIEILPQGPHPIDLRVMEEEDWVLGTSSSQYSLLELK